MLRAFTASSVYAAEAPALDSGQPLMALAAQALADRVIQIHRDEDNPQETDVVVFAGSGNNGGDGLYAAANLAQAGLNVQVALGSDLTGTETERALHSVRSSGIAVLDDLDELTRAATAAMIWVDALVGIGMKPPARGQLGEVIDALKRVYRERGRPPIIVAVDLPSGLNADTGEVDGPALRADYTVTFGGYKAAQFLPPAAYKCGHVALVDIGICEELAAQEAEVERVEVDDIRQWWLRPEPNDHKYTRGVVGMVTGSHDYPGAAVMSVGGALAAGPGMVRYLGEADGAVLAAHPEAIFQSGRVQAWVVGSGITGKGSSCAKQVEVAIRDALAADLPLVVDAGALEWVEGSTIAGAPISDRVVLTPHAGELSALLNRISETVGRSEVEADPGFWARKAAKLTGATVVLKGGITLIASPRGSLISQDDGTAWMATAGTGDVLAGVLGTTLAQWQVERASHNDPRRYPEIARAAAVGVALHGLSGRHASDGGPVHASQIAGAVTETLRRLLAD